MTMVVDDVPNLNRCKSDIKGKTLSSQAHYTTEYSRNSIILSLLVLFLVGTVVGDERRCPPHVKIPGATISPSGPVKSGGEVTVRCFANSFGGFGLFAQQTDKCVNGTYVPGITKCQFRG
ncbi:hypothetical protein DICVIV_13742 [Dictyocaulus viviparus]|uniref:Uncharacterized protein n=1 Tax=Dictyocaulus viviparus TaxID=29172 RepID=A0A0D8X989_DICVI|nr:hypothetical protein DICVIV_13742 [Dictyocaulus viviparus]